jgi:molybdenum cofactor cytidylyltransferase
MNLSQALRISPPPSLRDTSPREASCKDKSKGFLGGWEGVAIVGSGGKTVALFQLAHELAPAVVTTTTHLGTWQIAQADQHFILSPSISKLNLESHLTSGVTLVTGSQEGDRFGSLAQNLLFWLRAATTERGIPLLIEADGARQKPLKAPAEHEPVIPDFVEMVLVVAGLSGLGKPLTDETVHHPEIFARLSELKIGETITPEAIVRVLTHPNGGQKNIPANARRVVLLNQADTPELQSLAKGMAEKLLSAYDSAVVASLGQNQIHAVHEPVAGIILAAGEAKRFGQPKQLLDWNGRPFIRHAAETALAAGLSPVVVVTGANAEKVEAAVKDLPVCIVRNAEWQSGQSSSIRMGVTAIDSPPPSLRDTSPISCGNGGGRVGASIFLLADQPQVTPTVLRALVERHSVDLSPIVAPQVQGQRANPVLFDRITFPALMSLTGDVGGRAIFSKFPITYLPWHDESLLADIDTPEDYRRLVDEN